MIDRAGLSTAPMVLPSPRPSPDDRVGLEVEVRHRGIDTLVGVAGELDIATAPGFLATLDDLSTVCAGRAATGWTVWCDLSGLGFLSASGVTVLETAQRVARQRGVVLAFVSCSRPVRRVLLLVGSSLVSDAYGGTGASGR